MSLFTSPVTIATRIFSWVAQMPSSGNSIIGKWTEDAATSAEDSKLLVKQDESKDVPRRLLQHTIMKPITDGSLQKITVNFTVTHHKEHADSDVEDAVTLMAAATSAAGFKEAFLEGHL